MAKRYHTVFDRADALGLRFVGPQAPDGGPQAEPWLPELPRDSKCVPTFHHGRLAPASASRQLDFVFATDKVAERVRAVRALNDPHEWGPSDHCRVLIELDVP
jgi:endonuclease/exonuclease/phosphatase family metal-dependent hydrolase